MSEFFVIVKNHIQSNKLVTVLLCLLFAGLFIWACVNDSIIHFLGYVSAILLSGAAVEFFSTRHTMVRQTSIKKVKSEVGVLGVIIALQFIISLLRFVVFSDFQSAQMPIRMILFVLMILVIYPVALIIYFFIIKKYKSSELGLGVNRSIWIAFIIIMVIGMMAYITGQEKIKLSIFYDKMGILQLLFLGFLTAAIPEEFMRFITQTRLNLLLNDNVLGWFLAAIIWAVIHIPNFYHQERNLVSAIMEAVYILPIGLLWGYMTQRFNSIWPSVMVHGTNLWGFT